MLARIEQFRFIKKDSEVFYDDMVEEIYKILPQYLETSKLPAKTRYCSKIIFQMLMKS